MSKFVNTISYNNTEINILRLDVLQPIIQGNKYYKLKYNLLKAKEENKNTVLTFGGEYSNHIHAFALAGKEQNFKAIGIIRGDKPDELTCTIKESIENGMQAYFLNRTDYRIARKLVNNEKFEDFFDLLEQNNINVNKNDCYIVPEGGTNLLALQGTSEILDFAKNIDYNNICCAIGTAGTIVGIIASARNDKKIIGFPALKGNFFEKDIENYLLKFKNRKYSNWKLKHDYHFKGFGSFNQDLIDFINRFYAEYKIPICSIYTGKMFYGIFDMIDKGEFTKEDKILAIHTGGLQGIKAFNEKNSGLLNFEKSL